MSQSRFSIVLVGVSALLRRPLVSRLRPADGERSSWVVFAARCCLPFRRLPLGGLVLLPSVSALPLGELAFGLTASAFRHALLRSCPRRVGLRAHGFRFRHAPLRGCPRRVGSTAFRFGVALGGLVLLPSVSELPLGGLAFWLTASAFRHAPLRGCPRRLGLRAHGFRFSACADPHRRAADARADGVHRHDTCFTSKHLSQHVNLPHRSP